MCSMKDEARTGMELRAPIIRPLPAGVPAMHNDAAETNTLQRLHPGDIIDWFKISGRPARYLHLPLLDAKHSRRHLQARLPAALQFVSHHLMRGRRVLIHDADGKSHRHAKVFWKGKARL